MTAIPNVTEPRQTIDFQKGYYMLLEEVRKPLPKHTVNPTHLPLEKIMFASSVFQPRCTEGSKGEQAGHRATLALAIRSNPNHMLDPVLVWWTGRTWRCVDGHHRLAAYAQCKKDRKRPVAIDQVAVEVFEGTLDDAMVEATRRNSKDKLPMLKTDKLERAWKFTTLRTMSRSCISDATGVSESTVARMRVVMEEWIARKNTGKSFEGLLPDCEADPLSVTWEEAKRRDLREKIGDDHEEWEAKQAAEWCDRLTRAFGSKLIRQPLILAHALAIYSEKLPPELYEALRGYVDEERQRAIDEDEED